MKKIIAFGGSNSKESINKQLASYAANKVENVEVSLLDLNDFDPCNQSYLIAILLNWCY